MAPPVDPTSSPPTSPISVVIQDSMGTHTKETMFTVDSDYESESASMLMHSDVISSTSTSMCSTVPVSLQNSLSDSDLDSARPMELSPWPNPSKSPHPGLAPLESATPTIASSAGPVATQASVAPPILSDMSTSHRVDPPSSQSEGAHDVSQPLLSEDIYTRLFQRFIVEQAERDQRLKQEHAAQTLSLTGKIDGLEGQIGQLVNTVNHLTTELKTNKEDRVKDREEFDRKIAVATEEHARDRAEAAEKYARDSAATAKELARQKADYARDKAATSREQAVIAEKYTNDKAAIAEEYARDKAATVEAHRQEKEHRQQEFSYIVQELDTLKTWACSKVILSSFPHSAYELIGCPYNLQDNGALTAIHSRTVCDKVLRSLCSTFKLPTYAGGTNAPVVFKQWLDAGMITQAQHSDKSDVIDEDSLRKKFLKAQLETHLKGPHSSTEYSTHAISAVPSLQALYFLYHSEEALDVLTQKKHIIREEGNFAAHTLISLDRFANQLEQPEGQSHMAKESVTGMKVLIQFCKCIVHKFPDEAPPAGSTLWTSGSKVDTPATKASLTAPLLLASPPAPTLSESTPPASTPAASVPPGSASSSRPKASAPASRSKGSGSGGSGSTKCTRSSKGR